MMYHAFLQQISVSLESLLRWSETLGDSRDDSDDIEPKDSVAVLNSAIENPEPDPESDIAPCDIQHEKATQAADDVIA